MKSSAEAKHAIESAYRARTGLSAALVEQSRQLIPGGVTRSVTFYPPYPLSVAHGSGCRVTDVDGHTYVDHLNNFGSMIHGHAHPEVVAAIRQQVGRGIDFGAPTELQLEHARMISTRVPSVERVRFTSSGTESVLYAVRAARAFTRRAKILKMEGSYHGGYDSVTVSVDPGAGAPAWPEGKAGSRGLSADISMQTLVAPFNDLDRAAEIVRTHAHELAAVIIEPVTVRGMIAAEAGFLRGMREVTREHDVLLILDEVVTFRLSPGGAQARFGIAPDLTTFGKIIGGGLPLGAFGGRADVMAGFDPAEPEPLQHSGTFAGNSAALAAGLVTLELFHAADSERLNTLGDSLRHKLGVAVESAGLRSQVVGLGSLVGLHFSEHAVRDYRSGLAGNRELMRWFHLALLNRGVFARSTGSFFLSTPMTEADIDSTVAAVAEAAEQVRPIAAAVPA